MEIRSFLPKQLLPKKRIGSCAEYIRNPVTFGWVTNREEVRTLWSSYPVLQKVRHFSHLLSLHGTSFLHPAFLALYKDLCIRKGDCITVENKTAMQKYSKHFGLRVQIKHFTSTHWGQIYFHLPFMKRLPIPPHTFAHRCRQSREEIMLVLGCPQNCHRVNVWSKKSFQMEF